MPFTRRTFLATGTASWLAAAPPSDEIRLGLIGAGGRGTFVMTVFQKDPAVKAVAICDVYEPNLERGLSTAAKAQPGVSAKPYRNYKQLLADPSINAVLIATPEHWHHRMVLDALAAGKDVYVEKPLCQTRNKAWNWWKPRPSRATSSRWECSAAATTSTSKRAT